MDARVGEHRPFKDARTPVCVCVCDYRRTVKLLCDCAGGRVKSEVRAF